MRNQDQQQAKARVKWPKASERSQWEQLDEDLQEILESCLSDSVNQKVKTMTRIITTVAQQGCKQS